MMENILLPPSVIVSDELKKRIEVVKGKAQTAEAGSTFFIEVSSLPLVSLFIVTGEEITDNNGLKPVHLHFAEQSALYPTIFQRGSKVETIGYSRYLKEDVLKDKISLSDYQNKLISVCVDINKSIRPVLAVTSYTYQTFFLYPFLCDMSKKTLLTVDHNKIVICFYTFKPPLLIFNGSSIK